MDVKLIKKSISKDQLEKIAENNYRNMVKGVVDIKQKIIALGGELHADAEEALLRNNSNQKDLWGFNIYTDKPKEKRLEYTSFINIRPSQDNRSLEIQDENLRNKIHKIIDSLIE